MFVAASVNYRAVLEEFDAQDGLRRLLNTLRALVAQLRCGEAVGKEGRRNNQVWRGRGDPPRTGRVSYLPLSLLPAPTRPMGPPAFAAPPPPHLPPTFL